MMGLGIAMSDDARRPGPDDDSADWDPRKSTGEVRLRRWKRRLKAAASLGLALAAGTFLACQKTPAPRQPVPPNPTTPETGPQLPPLPPPDLAAPAPASAPAPTTELVKVPPKPEEHPKKGKVDQKEHRKGMPVRDNLLE